jgi:probable rRNA maturation factor
MIDADHSEITINTAALGRFLRYAQKEVGLTGEVNVLITSDQEMRRLNREFRRKNKPTDVLSFPASLKSKIAGDIAISGEIARLNAQDLGHPVESELKVLLLHGLLHLAGYDHDADNGKMAKREQQLRVKLKLPTGLIARTHAVGSIKDYVDSPAALSQRPQRRRPLRVLAGEGIPSNSMNATGKHPAEGGRIHASKRRSSAVKSPAAGRHA